MRQHDGLGMTAPELVSELNSFVIHSRHPELVSGSPGETATHYPGDADMRQHDGSGIVILNSFQNLTHLLSKAVILKLFSSS